MSTLTYRGTGESDAQSHGSWTQDSSRYQRPEDYIADPGLVNAVNVALLLDKPLLLTGEPGTGKSQLAYSLAWELGFDQPLKFETKSTSAARDLFYTFDAIGRFKAADEQQPLNFVRYNALGLAILYSNEESSVAKYMPHSTPHGGIRRSVVLIDEVDKAPRDFPNDILNELEHLQFSIPEIGSSPIQANKAFRPLVVITSNSEKDLPDAFLRRCIYFNLPFPEQRILQRILVRRLGEFSGDSSALLSKALDLFFKMREPATQLRKNPATSELLDWLIALQGSMNGGPRVLTRDLAARTMSSLVKTAEDQAKAQQVLDRWFKER